MHNHPTFEDGHKLIDMVLAYDKHEKEEEQKQYRHEFQRNMTLEGLEWELDETSSADTNFVKIHIRYHMLKAQAKLHGMKPPFVHMEKSEYSRLLKDCQNISNGLRRRSRLAAYTSAQRTFIVWKILARIKYTDGKKGIQRLLNNNTYTAAYPLHDGPYRLTLNEDENIRKKLFDNWASMKNWHKKQPLWEIKTYYGDKVGLYFAWLGFYTKMLVPASCVGFVCFIYGITSFYANADDTRPSDDICNEQGMGNTTLCPLCDQVCNYMKLSESCHYSKLSYVFDNPATVIFAVFMSFWATIFLELWQRKQIVLKWHWELSKADEDLDTRPEYEASVKTTRISPVTGIPEPYVTNWNKTMRMTASISSVLFLLSIVVIAVLAVIVYRISVTVNIHANGYSRDNAKIITSVTASIINLCIIMILMQLYESISTKLTDMENPRTQDEYEKSRTFKIFIFQASNFYSSLFYIAFFKGQFYTYPGDESARSNVFQRLKADICDPAGCFSELFIQLVIIMIGKQIYNNVMEIILPLAKNWWARRKSKGPNILQESVNIWEMDFKLVEVGSLTLFKEYLEMVVQYGFVTMFVAAFPLAPIFALLNNIVEIRVDAFKFITQMRRPLPDRAEDIGAWFGILRIITYISVVTNAFVIAFTTDFIPRLVYRYVFSKDGSLQGYIKFTLSEFNTSDYKSDMGPILDSGEISPATCFYRAFRNGPGTVNEYELSYEYWYIFCIRIIFIVIFEHVVLSLTGLLAYAIPDMPQKIKYLMLREKLISREKKLKKNIQKYLFK